MRVSAASDRGFGPARVAAAAPVAPIAPPAAPSSVSISRKDAGHLTVEFPQTVNGSAAANGAAVTSYVVEWGRTDADATTDQSLTLVPDYTVQVVRTSIWRAPFGQRDAFALTLGDFRGAFSEPLGGRDAATGYLSFATIATGTNRLKRVAPDPARGVGAASFYKSIPRGGFLKVGGQEFRVCLSTVVEDVGPYDSANLTRVGDQSPGSDDFFEPSEGSFYFFEPVFAI